MTTSHPGPATDRGDADQPAEPDALAQAMAILAAMPAVLPRFVDAIEPALLERRPTADEWSAREVLGHLLYVERLLDDRIGRMAEGPGQIDMPPGPPAPEPGPVDETVEAWLAARRASLARLGALRPDQLDRVGVHRRYGPITVREHVVEWAYHDLEHLRQLAAVVEAALYPAIGGWRALYPAPLGELPAPLQSAIDCAPNDDHPRLVTIRSRQRCPPGKPVSLPRSAGEPRTTP